MGEAKPVPPPGTKDLRYHKQNFARKQSSKTRIPPPAVPPHAQILGVKFERL